MGPVDAMRVHFADGIGSLPWLYAYDDANAGVFSNGEEAPVGGAGYDAAGDPLPEATLNLCKNSDAILLGAVGGPQYESLPREKRPEKGLLGLRSELTLFSNLRPAILYPQLADASSLRPEIGAE